MVRHGGQISTSICDGFGLEQKVPHEDIVVHGGRSRLASPARIREKPTTHLSTVKPIHLAARTDARADADVEEELGKGEISVCMQVYGDRNTRAGRSEDGGGRRGERRREPRRKRARTPMSPSTLNRQRMLLRKVVRSRRGEEGRL
jgi:hypothetical protein